VGQSHFNPSGFEGGTFSLVAIELTIVCNSDMSIGHCAGCEFAGEEPFELAGLASTSYVGAVWVLKMGQCR
jgi:hypothetical protein